MSRGTKAEVRVTEFWPSKENNNLSSVPGSGDQREVRVKKAAKKGVNGRQR
jgi:hypothetical protein